MERAFPNRTEAGRQLAEKLVKYAGREDVIVLGLPRGGVPVAFEVAQRLGAPLDVFIGFMPAGTAESKLPYSS